MSFQLYDDWSLWVVFAGALVILFLSAEAGFVVGKLRARKIKNQSKEEKQAGSILVASLGLLAFLLAFTFSMASNIHYERKSLVLEEANAIGTFYLRTDLLSPESAKEIRDLLHRYIDIRLQARSSEAVGEVIRIKQDSDEILARLWPATIDACSGVSAPKLMLLIDAANKVIDLHGKRMNAVYKRLPEMVNLTLIIIAVTTLGLLGYQSGLNGVRILVPRFALILPLATVMLLVVDLDRPGGILIEVGHQALIDLNR